MNFSCEKDILQELLTTASRAVTGKSSMPLLECLLIKAENDTLTVTGYDLAMGIRTKTDEVVIDEEGCILLNAKLFVDIVRKLPFESVHVSCNDRMVTTIKCGRAIFNLTALNAEEYPNLAEVSTGVVLHMPQGTLKSMIAQTIFSIADNESKPVLTGCLFELAYGELTIVAVDGYRISIRRENVEDIKQMLQFVVPGSALREVERILTDGDDDIEIYPDKQNILFQIGNTTLITRLLEGEFLKYHNAIPHAFTHTLLGNRRELIESVERVSLLASEKLKNPIWFQFNESIVQMSCSTAIGTSYDECEISGAVKNMSLEIGFNFRFLLEAFRAIPDDIICLQLNGQLNPMVLTPTTGSKYTYLILPVRPRNNG